MASAYEKVTKVAESEVGYLEKKSNKDLDNKTANAGSANYTKYGEWIGANGDYWCASFLSWLFYKAFGDALGKKILCGAYSPACETIRQNFIKAGRYDKTPKVGDVIFFSGTRHNGANHIGYVYKVSGNTVYTIEGNTSGGSSVVDNGGGVAKKNYSTSYSRILGYGKPKYDLGTSTKKETTKSKKTYTGAFPTLPSRGYFKKGDKGTQVKNLQKFLNWYGGYKLTVDGDFGSNTYAAVRNFQSKENLTVDGQFGKKSLEKAKTIKK